MPIEWRWQALALFITATVTPAATQGFQLPPVAAPEHVTGAPITEAIQVDEIQIGGNKAVPARTLRAAAAPYLHRQLTPAQVEELRELLTHQYTDQGYINSGVILDPSQPYSQGTLRLRVIEGRISRVNVRGLKRLHPAYVVDRLRGSASEIFNVNVLRARFQRLLDDPLFARLNSQILPGEQLGEAVLDVDADRARPYALSVALNNYRPPSIGEKGFDVSGLVRDLSGWGDVLDANLNGPLASSGGLGYGVGWQVPLNHYYTQLSLRYSHSDSVVTEQPLDTLDIRSHVDRQELRLTQPLFASLTQQFNLGASAAYERDTTSLAGLAFSFLPGATEGVTRAVAFRFSPDYSYRTQNQYLGLRLTLLRAILLDQSSEAASFEQPDHHYSVWTGQAHHVWDVPKLPLELDTRVTAQWTGARISDLHAVEVGGIDSVRGFRENELLLANVHQLNVDLRWIALRPRDARLPTLTLGPFFDWASGYDVGQPKTSFSSTGATLKAKWSHLQADLAVGARLITPSFVDQQSGTWQDHGILAQIAATL
jgi:hemolysin activation/secretion protein